MADNMLISLGAMLVSFDIADILRATLYDALVDFDPEGGDAAAHQMEYLRVRIAEGKATVVLFESECLQHAFYGREAEILPVLSAAVQKRYSEWLTSGAQPLDDG